MKVHIDKYKDFFGPYKAVEFLKYFGVSDEMQDRIADKLPMAPFHWIDKIRGPRKTKVHIDRWDTWSMDHTLALIIHPMLIQLKNTKQGSPHVDDEDVPEHLRSSAATPLTQDQIERGEIDALHHERWNYVLDEMIYAFACEIDENWEDQFHSGEIDHVWVETEENGQKMWELQVGPNHTHVFDHEAQTEAMNRRANGRMLFAKYYHALWD